MSATITFKQGDSMTQRGTVWMEQGVSLQALRTFAQRLQSYTTATIEAVSHEVHDYVMLEPWGSGEYNSVSVYAHIFIRNRNSGTVYGFKLLSPDDSIFDAEQEVTDTFGNQFAQWFSDLSGEIYDFEHGALAGSTE